MDALTSLVIVLLVLWITGAFVVPTTGLVHALLIIVVVLLVVRVLKGQRW